MSTLHTRPGQSSAEQVDDPSTDCSTPGSPDHGSAAPCSATPGSPAPGSPAPGSAAQSSPAPGSAPTDRVGRLAGLLTGRRSAWAVLAISVVVLLAVMGGIRGTGPVAGMDALPAEAESSQVHAIAQRLDGQRYQPVFAVVTRADGGKLTDADQASIAELREQLAAQTGRQALGPMPSEDGKADLAMATVDVQRDDEQVDQEIADLRATASQWVPDSLQVQVTGGPAVGADIRGAFAGADFRLLAVTLAVVAVLLLLTYRSPVLWLLPLTVVALAEGASRSVTGFLGEQMQLAFDSGVVSVLVFGAGTNYALLLISRYREELRRHENHRTALATAWRGTAPAILASNLTVVLALLTLLLAVMPATRGLGIASAAGLLLALLAVLFPLTALLAATGRRVFWPFVPRAEQPTHAQAAVDEASSAGVTGAGAGVTRATAAAAGATEGAGGSAADVPSASPRGDSAERSVFGRIASAVAARPLAWTIGVVALLGLLATGLVGTRVGLAQSEQFADTNESASGFAVMAEHYGAGESAPHRVAVPTSQADALTAQLETVPGIERVTPVGQTSDGWSVIDAVGSAEPESDAAFDEVRALRWAAADTAPEALVGGTSATALDVREDSFRDLAVIAPVILAVVLVVLVVLLRSLVAPFVLLAANLLSTMAAIGLGLWVGGALFDIPALDVTVPLLAFLFLVALGVDYTIFLVHRARHEAAEHGTNAGMVRAVGSTGVVITSAGVVLAAVFAALGVLPLVVLFQLGLIVGLGVLLDTLVVRTMLVPALFALVGDRMWWPTRP